MLLRLTTAFIFGAALLLCCGVPVLAQDGAADQLHSGPTEVFEIFCAERVEKAFGVILKDGSESPTAQVDKFVKLKQQNPNNFASNSRPAAAENVSVRVWKVTVQLQPEDYVNRRKLAAVVFTNSGEIISAEVRQLGAPASSDITVGLKCQPVETRADYQELLALNNEKLKMLADIREKKYEVLIKFIREYMNSDVILGLQELERKHNLIHQNPITAEMSIHELTKRIAVLEAFEAAKGD